MRTLNDLLKLAQEARTEHAANVAKHKQDYKEASEALAKAQADAKAAISSGDQEAYEQARKAEEYWSARAASLNKVQEAPHFSPDEHNAIVDEVNKALRAEMHPLYKHLWEVIDDWNNTISQLNEKQRRAYSIGSVLYSILPDDEKAGRTHTRWSTPMGGMEVSHRLSKVFNPNIPSDAMALLNELCPRKR